MQFNISTTGQNVTLEDFDITLTHPETVNLLDSEDFTASDISSSFELETLLSNGTLIALDENGFPIKSTFFTKFLTELPFFQVNNINTVTNINTNTDVNFITTIPISGDIQNGSDNIFFTKTTNGIQCNFDGIVFITANIDMFSSGARANVQSRIKLNGLPIGSTGSSGYIRNSTGHNESSTHCSTITQVSIGDEITVGARRESTNSSSVFLNTSGTSNLIVIKIG